MKHRIFSALRRFRQTTQPRFLWADAVCINQASLSERSQQVALKSRIYKGAVRMLGWVGEGNDRNKDSQEWSQRKWIVQEVALAREIV
jgi:hypothetical protein